jgi:hypothetical protein
MPALRVGVHDAADVFARGMHRGMDHEAGRVHRPRALLDLAPLEIDLHQRRRGDLVEGQAVGIDQEVMRRPRQPRGDVGVDRVVHAVQRDQPVAGGELDAQLAVRAQAAPGERRREIIDGDGHGRWCSSGGGRRH